MLPVNQVFKIGELRKRLLLSGVEQVVWIDIDSDTALPESISVAELERQLMKFEIESIADPFEGKVLREVGDGSLDQIKRDEAWGMLADYVHDPQLFMRSSRGLIVRDIMERHGVTKQTVYRLLRRYWQRGICRNALLPDYVNSGARGKRRNPSQAKLGRPRMVMEGKGSNITPDIERIFRRVIEERLLKEKHLSIPDAYASALNLLRAVLPKLSTFELPTLGQFRYFYGRDYHFTDTLPCQTALKSFQVTASKSFQLLKLFSRPFSVV
ncbi:helix-turn-helix domain-containing protein [Pseudomonas sp. PS01302]|uniref:helix-turn-helix domain-containing protein n=1 Tax=Pseudomonas sp. PS01302 TaxID=2991438 RepID=UPI00249A1B82|nr:helix-turn-helix domain-containing protein [Pseudomonas sp. PS01302]